MAKDIGEVVIQSAPDEQQTGKVYDKAGKKAATRFVREMERGIRRLVSDAAATFGGARGRGAANLLLSGLPAFGAGAAAGGGVKRAAGAAAGLGPAGIGAIGAVAVVAAIGLGVRALNKNTAVQVRNLSSVSPLLARVQAEGSVQELRQRVITARLFETSLASTARTLQSARGELFKAKLGLTAVKVVFGDITANIKLGVSKALAFLIIDLPLGVRKLTNSIKIGVFNLLAEVVDFLIPGEAGDSLAEGFRMQARLLQTQNEMIKRITKALEDARAKGSIDEMNNIMLQELRKIGRSPAGFRPMQTPQGVPVVPGR